MTNTLSKAKCPIITLFAVAASPLAFETSPAFSAPIISGGIYNESSSQSCESANCSLTFTQIPAGKNLIVTDVSCSVRTENASGIPQISLRQTGAVGNYYLSAIFRGNRTISGGATLREYVANETVSLIVPSLRFPRVNVFTFGGQGTVVDFDCMIAGQLRQNP